MNTVTKLPIDAEMDAEELVPQVQETVESKEDAALIEAMIKAGISFGHKKSKSHPKMGPYVYAVRNEIQIIDVSKTLSHLRQAVDFLKPIIARGGKILFVGTHASAKETVREVATALGMPYVAERWLGGTLTNFHTMKKRITYFLDLEKKKSTGELEKYTKKERLLFDRELKKLENNLGGIKAMEKLPDAIFIIDITTHAIAVHEANKSHVPVVAICDTDSNPTPVAHVIPANDNSYHAIKFLMESVKNDLAAVKRIAPEEKK